MSEEGLKNFHIYSKLIKIFMKKECNYKIKRCIKKDRRKFKFKD